MKAIRAILAYGFAGMAVHLIWGHLATPFGLWAGVVGALCAIGPVWYLVHYRKAIPDKDTHLAVDMGMAIGVAAFVRDSLRFGGGEVLKASPTLLLVLLGATGAGLLSAWLEKKRSKR